MRAIIQASSFDICHLDLLAFDSISEIVTDPCVFGDIQASGALHAHLSFPAKSRNLWILVLRPQVTKQLEMSRLRSP
jgi:hypothetical protein